MRGEPKPSARTPALDGVTKLRTPDARVSALGIARATSRDIERGLYPPGARLREQELADAFGCSRAPVREALRILESQGLVVIEPMKGARIATTSDADFFEVFLIRRALAGLMARQAALAAPGPAKAELVRRAGDLRQLAAEGAPAEAFGREVRRAIRALIAVADTPRTVQLVRSLTFGHEAFQVGTFPTRRDRLANAAAWGRLADAVEAGRANAAREAIERLFDLALSAVNRGSR